MSRHVGNERRLQSKNDGMQVVIRASEKGKGSAGNAPTDGKFVGMRETGERLGCVNRRSWESNESTNVTNGRKDNPCAGQDGDA